MHDSESKGLNDGSGQEMEDQIENPELGKLMVQYPNSSLEMDTGRNTGIGMGTGRDLVAKHEQDD